MRTFKRILSDILFGVGTLWQLFVTIGVLTGEKTIQNLAIGALLTMATIGVLYISLKIRPPRGDGKHPAELNSFSQDK